MHQNQMPTPGVEYKFNADGTPRLFPGNTILCRVDHASPIGRTASAFGDAIRRQPWGAKWALLPPSSYHMTVMELVCDQIRTAELWSSGLPLDASLTDTDVFFEQRVPTVVPPSTTVMRVAGLHRHRFLELPLAAVDSATETALRTYRQALALHTGVRAPDHDQYGFHMSLAYQVLALDPGEATAVESLCAAWEERLLDAGACIVLPAPELTFFDDMFDFVPAAERLTLRSRRGAAAPLPRQVMGGQVDQT